MKKVLSYLKPYYLPMTVALALMLVELVVELMQPLFIAKVINEGIMTKDLDAVMLWGAVMLGLTAIGFVSGIINSYFAAYVSQHYGFDLRKSLFAKIQSFSFANFNQFPTATLITRVTSDVTTMQNLMFMGMRIMLRAPLMLVGGLVMSLFVNMKLAFILVIVSPILFFFLVWLMRTGFRHFHAVQERLDHANSVLRENLLGMRLIKSFVRDKHEEGRFVDSNQQLMDRTVKALRLVETAVPTLTFVMNASILLILWFGHEQIVGQAGTNVGDVVAIVNYTARMTGALSMISMIVTNISRARASALRIEEVLNAEADIVEKEQLDPNQRVAAGSVVFEGVSFHYPDHAVAVLENLNFEIKQGERVAFLGATGSGKTSMFQLIPRLYDVSEGRVLVDGQDVRDLSLDRLRGAIGYVPQEALLFSGTIADNIRWGRTQASDDEVVDAAKRAQIHDTIMKLPKQYDTIIGQKGVNLSGGQKQRLSIARALVRQPKVLLLDDSTSALDVKTEGRLLRSLPTDTCTTLLITQKISTAMRADRVVLLDDGKLLGIGTHDELMKQSELYRRIAESQFGEEAVSLV